jgi:hypothetical protein
METGLGDVTSGISIGPFEKFNHRSLVGIEPAGLRFRAVL